MVKKAISVIVALVISIMSFSILTVSAEEVQPDVSVDNSIGFYWMYTNYVESSISKSGNNVTCISEVDGIPSVTKIVVTQTLQKNSANGWYDYKPPKSKTFYSSTATYLNTYNNVIIGTYRTKTVAKVYKGTSYETVGPAYSVSITVP